MLKSIPLLAAACLALTVAAHADTLSTFATSNLTVANGATLTGNVSIDVTTGQVQSGSFLYTLGTMTNTFNLLSNPGESFDNGTQTFFNLDDAAGDDLSVDIGSPSLINYAGGSLCTAAAPCGTGSYRGAYFPAAGAPSQFNTGSLAFVSSVQTSVTPEPGSFTLLGTGALALIGFGRRKLCRA